MNGTGQTHAEGTESGTKDGTEEWRFRIDVLRWSNSLDYLSDNTTTIDTVSFRLL